MSDRSNKSDARKSVAVLGSTGSIGRQTLDLLEHSLFAVFILVCNTNIELVASQAMKFRPRFVASLDATLHDELSRLINIDGVTVIAGQAEIIRILTDHRIDVTIVGLTGFAALDLTLAAAQCSNVVGIANKESIVCAWHLILAAAKKSGAHLIPIDSEHNSAIQIIQEHGEINSVTLTASGGPFRSYSYAQMSHVSVAEAAKHPTWRMGQKISIDSATLMNKALEMVEAKRIFAIDDIRAIIHPESIVHCIVEFIDTFCAIGACLPNMKVHIAHVLHWPNRTELKLPFLNLATAGSLHFIAIDEKIFPSLRIAREVMRKMGNYPTVMNAANEEAVHMFIRGEIKFTEITEVIEFALDNILHKTGDLPVEEIRLVDHTARRVILNRTRKITLPA